MLGSAVAMNSLKKKSFGTLKFCICVELYDFKNTEVEIFPLEVSRPDHDRYTMLGFVHCVDFEANHPITKNKQTVQKTDLIVGSGSLRALGKLSSTPQT